MNKFLTGRLKSIKYVFKGMILIIKTEAALKAQLFVFIIFMTLGFFFQISIEDWKWQFFIFGLIFATESLNTSVEKLCDFIHPNHHKRIGFIKDISAGAVGFVALFGFVIAILIYAKYIFPFS